MDPEKQREIARLGGRAAHEKGTAHEFTPDEARRAGRRGGRIVSRDRDYMAEIGRRGGLHSQGGRGQTTAARNTRKAGSNGHGRGTQGHTGRGTRAKAATK
jgi:general stress protein YciG